MRTALVASALALALVVPGARGSASPGWLDTGFGRNGVLRPTFVGNDKPAAVLVQRDGKIVIAAMAISSASQSDFALARYRPDGKPDSSFGHAGTVRVDVGTGRLDSPAAAVVQPDGRIVVAGWSRLTGPPYRNDLALIRLNADGSLDPAFGQGGKVLTDVGASAAIYALALQPDGKLVVAGSRANDDRFDGQDILVARYSPEGSLDPTFDGDGWLVTQLRTVRSEFARAVAVQRDGSIVVGGGGGHFGEPGLSIFDSAVIRYRPDGALDTSFGDGGQVLVNLSTNDWVADLLVQPDGRIVAAATAGDWLAERPSRFALLRFTADGALDRGFGQAGKVLTGFTRNPHDSAAALVRDPGGTLVVAGAHRVRSGETRSNFALARYRANGALDKRFGHGGLLQTDLGGDEEIVDLARQPDGKLVALGSRVRAEVDWGIALARYVSIRACIVPNVLQSLVRQARRALSLAGCRVGRVTRRRSHERPGLVIRQRPAAGAELPRGGKVNLVVSRR